MNGNLKSPWFHQFLIWFALFAFAAFYVYTGVRNISYAYQDRHEFEIVIIILSVAMILLALCLIKVRFDLAAFRDGAPKELLIVMLALAGVSLVSLLIPDSYDTSYLMALLPACWGVACYRYYQPTKEGK